MHRCSVLIVDDDAEVREMVRLALTADRYRTATAGNGRDALDYLRSTTDTCVILLNLMMPAMDGAQFRAAQLRDRSLAWIPIVVISGTVDGGQQARALGAKWFVRKPIDLDQVRQALQHIGCVRSIPRRAERGGR
jgi:CheY-like chemotaxis protein